MSKSFLPFADLLLLLPENLLSSEDCIKNA
jgi:hypothetical protein